MERLNSWPYFRAVVLGSLVLILVVNGMMFASLRREIADIERRPVFASCTSSSLFGDVPPDGVYSVDVHVDPNSYSDGKVQVAVLATLTQKIPGSEVLLLYRSKEASFCQEIPMVREDGILQYSASFITSTTDEIEYRLAERVKGEIVHATRPKVYDLVHLVGTGDVWMYYTKKQGSSDITWSFVQKPVPQVVDLQIKEITLKVNKTKPESFTLSQAEQPDGTFSVTFNDDGFESMQVTVVYKDGQTRTALYLSGTDIQNPIIKR